MKKIYLLLLVAVLTASCTTYQQPYKSVLVYDYSPLTSKGIFVTESNSVSFDYEPVGSIEIIMLGGRKVSTTNYYSATKNSSGEYEHIPFKDITNELVSQLNNLNANGIINLKVVFTPPSDKHGSGYIVSGMAIKR